MNIWIAPPQKKENRRRTYFFWKPLFFLDNVENFCTAGQATDECIALAHCVLDNEGYKHTLRMFKIYCFSVAKIFTPTRLQMLLILHCLSFVMVVAVYWKTGKMLRCDVWVGGAFCNRRASQDCPSACDRTDDAKIRVPDRLVTTAPALILACDLIPSWRKQAQLIWCHSWYVTTRHEQLSTENGRLQFIPDRNIKQTAFNHSAALAPAQTAAQFDLSAN